MLKKKNLPFLLIFCILLLLMSRSKHSADWIRDTAITFIAPIWQWTAVDKFDHASLLTLQIENQLLKNEVVRMQELLKEAFYFQQHLQQHFSPSNSSQNHFNDFKTVLKRRLEAVPARVIYRASASWNSFLWIDAGTSTNEILKRQIVAKNSPVVVGNSLIGVIDYVGEQQSRVRLITDTALYPSVRAARGSPQGLRLIETIHVLLDNLIEYDALFDKSEEREQLSQQLQKLQNRLAQERDTLYLAKGELQGCSAPQKRSHGNLLKGVGFNYDFADDKGPARDLRSGIPYLPIENMQPIPLLKVHDILVTSGMDGIFPEGFQVAEVVHIDPLEEGGYYYELQAKPTAGNLDSLALVYVLSPQGYDPALSDID